MKKSIDIILFSTLVIIDILTIDCSHVHSIIYNKQNGIDYYYANKQQTVTTNLKSILPPQLSQPPAEVADSLPQVANNLAIVRGNNPRGRSAKQIQGFNDNNNDLEINNNSNDNREAKELASQNNVCLTPGCVKAAAEILKNVDETVDPCDDFYKYSCGNWIESQIIPEDKTSVSLFSVVQDELDNKLRNLIERDSTAEDAPIVEKMRNLYESCMNTCKYILILKQLLILKQWIE